MAEGGQRKAERSRQPGRQTAVDKQVPAAGPHAKPELTDENKTPKSGMLPEPDQNDTEAPTG